MHYSSDSTSFWLIKRCSVVAVVVLWLGSGSIGLAKTKKPQPDQFPPNPLEITVPDPLLPQGVIEPLSPSERVELEAALQQLNQQAAARLQAGDEKGAFEIWYREVRLRRSLGSVEELQALSRVGAIAWNENQRTEVQFITQRLNTIQQQAKKQPAVDVELLGELGNAYRQVRSPKQALEVYDQILVAARQQQNPAAEESTLNTIAELHLSWFDYPKAAATYEELLSLARANDRSLQVTYLQQLVYIYEQSKQPQMAIAHKQELAELYLNEQDIAKLPALKLSVASDYETLTQIEEAFQNYQEAYASAWSLQQYYRAADALRKLVALYRSQSQIEAALEASEILLEADRLATNAYGLMNTYDQIGQMHRESGNYSEALTAFQKGLELAKQLQYQEPYFTQQIEEVSQQSK